VAKIERYAYDNRNHHALYAFALQPIYRDTLTLASLDPHLALRAVLAVFLLLTVDIT
jgi:hypothetical protein